jgi:hypothetical protein
VVTAVSRRNCRWMSSGRAPTARRRPISPTRSFTDASIRLAATTPPARREMPATSGRNRKRTCWTRETIFWTWTGVMTVKSSGWLEARACRSRRICRTSRAVSSTRAGSLTSSLAARIVSTFITRRMAVEIGMTTSSSRSMPWASVPRGSRMPITRKRTEPTRISAPNGSSSPNSSRTMVSPTSATRAERATAAASKYSPLETPRSQTRSERSDCPSTRAVPLAFPERTVAPRNCCGSQASIAGSSRASASMSSSVIRAPPARGPSIIRPPPEKIRIDEEPKSWRTVDRILRSAPSPTDTTKVSAATPRKLPSIMKPLRSLNRAIVRRLCRTRRSVLMAPPR